MWGIVGLGVGAVLAAVLLLASGGSAGDYHFGATLICSDCHIMHASTQHTYGGQPLKFSNTPTAFLLKGENVCLVCHDGTASPPDVLEDNPGGNVRPAGALNTTTSNGTYKPYMGHSLGSTDMAPGGTFKSTNAAGLTCTDCHNQHGGTSGQDILGRLFNNTAIHATGTYRNLRARRVGDAGSSYSVSYAVTNNDLTKDVFEIAPKTYEAKDVNLNEPVTDNSGMATWCRTCHTDFHGKAGDANMGASVPDVGGGGPEEWKRHPAAQVNIGALGGGHSDLARFKAKLYRVKVMSSTGDWGPYGAAWNAAPNDLSPTCSSCHKGHGSTRPFGLIYALGNAPLGENGDGTDVKHLCRQCHRQGAD
jgi:Zn-finger protein